MYLIELSDKRNEFLLNTMRANGAKPYIIGDSADENDCIIFSPAKKLTAEIAESLPKYTFVFGGAASSDVLIAFKNRGIRYFNMLSDEIFAVENANLTAEGALSFLISANEKSMFDNRILILGCGRVAKAFSILALRVGLNTAIATYSENEYLSSSFYAPKCYFGNEFFADIGQFDVIINTVPAPILTEHVEKIPASVAIIELASMPCVAAPQIEKRGGKYIKAPALPSKFCAESAAELMKKCIFRAIG